MKVWYITKLRAMQFRLVLEAVLYDVKLECSTTQPAVLNDINAMHREKTFLYFQSYTSVSLIKVPPLNDRNNDILNRRYVD